MTTFKVVLDGIDLSAEQVQRISKCIQRSVLNELADVDTADERADHGTRAFAWQPISIGETMGLVATQPPDEETLAGIVASEFGG